MGIRVKYDKKGQQVDGIVFVKGNSILKYLRLILYEQTQNDNASK